MLGLDRARVSIKRINIAPEQLKFNILQKFSIRGDIKTSNGEKIYIGDQDGIKKAFKFINFIKIGINNQLCSVEIEFNYTKYYRNTNFDLMKTQKEKENVDLNVLIILSEITEMDISKMTYEYSFLEVAEQLEIKRFTDYTNIIYLIYKALHLNKDFKKSGKVFYDYSSILDRFFTTGFVFSFKDGLTFGTYNKSLENNQKTVDESDKVNKSSLKNEFKFTKTTLKNIFGTSAVEILNLNAIREQISESLGLSIKNAVIEQLKKNQLEIEKRLDSLDSLTPRNIQLFVTENNEWILDYDWFNCILKNKLLGKKSERMIFRYQKMAKEKLIALEKSNSPKRSNTKNIKKLEQYLRILFGVKIEIELTKDGEIQIF
ncbi:MAG: hypothetical protein ACRCZO_09275 [Cetobacterium sp.]